MSIPPVEGFDQYRTERKRRHLDTGPKRPMGRNSSVLRELEAHEASAARNERMTREVQEFFEDATRTAATMVSKLANSAEREHNHSVAQEMSEFLSATLARARTFIEQMHSSGAEVDGVEELLPNIRNVVGPTLDAFRWEGSPDVAEAQIGIDPFAGDDEPFEGQDTQGEGASTDDRSEDRSEPEEQLEDDEVVEISIGDDYVPVDEYDDDGRTIDDETPAPIEEHLAAQLAETAPQSGASGSESGLLSESMRDSAFFDWTSRLADDDHGLRLSLKALVHVGTMSKAEARAIYQELSALRSN